MFAAPAPKEMFSDATSPTEIAERFEAYKEKMAVCHTHARQKMANGEIGFVRKQGLVHTETPRSRIEAMQLDIQSITKSLSADQVAAVTQALEAAKGVSGDLNKDWTLTNPLASGLVPYDLMSALIMLVPRSFVLRNSIGRIGGIGEAKEYRRITGITNAGVGGVANQSTFFASATQTASFQGLTLARPPKISYAADRKIVGYVEQGVSDEVLMQAQFAGQGYTDLRQLSHTAVTWAHMLGEERNMLYGRGSGTGYSGLTGAVTITLTANAGGGTLANVAHFVRVTQVTGQGESAASAEVSVTPAANGTISVNINSGISQGAVAFNVYASTVTNTELLIGSTTLTGAGSFTITAPPAGAGAFPVVDNSASAAGYDGLIPTYTQAGTTGYFNRLNATLSTTEPGKEFQDAFQSLYASVLADPEEVLMGGATRRELSKTVQQQGNPTGYRLTYELGQDGLQMGSVVTAIQNEVTGKMVDVKVHPYMPAGVALIRSLQLPFPDSGVSEITQAANVQDLLMLEWPVIQMSYDLSSYQYGTLLHYAPAWCGAIVGIQ